MDFDQIAADSVSRRAFLTRMTAAGLGLAAAGLLASPAAHASGTPLLDIVNVPDNHTIPGIPGRNANERVLNYALTLETLEADLYRQALNIAAGKTADTPLPADASTYALSIDASGVPHPALAFTCLQQFAAVEAAHRDFLRAAIQSMGGTPVEPNPGGYKAPFGTGLRSILVVIRTAEETGIRAYLGAASTLNDFHLIQTAASIHSTEARHAAAINYAMGLPIGPTKERLDSQAVINQYGEHDFEYFMTPEQVIARIKPFFA